MKRAELLAAIARDAGISKAEADKALRSFTFHVTRAMKRGGRVSLVGFGVFTVVDRKARTVRNPQTGKEIKVPASRQPKFRPGLHFKRAVR
ncbi:MAG: HU family DNA-binding protein [Nitrospirae bacterium]|nr:HU family DNA-binding protein [Nitrospirota bacterium]